MDARRLILFAVFSFSLLMLWEAWQKEHRPSVAPAAPTRPEAAPGPGALPALPTPRAGTKVPTSAAAESAQRERVRVRTDVLAAEIDTLGGDLVYLELLRHRDNADGKKNLVLLGPEHRYTVQSGLTGGLPFHRTQFATSPGERVLSPGADRLEVRLEAQTPEGVRVAKILSFRRSSYQIDIAEEIANGTSSPITTYAYFQITRDGKSPAGDPHMAQTYTGAALYTEQDKFQKISFSDIDKGKLPSRVATDGWIAMVQHYFVTAVLPPDKVQRDFYAEKLADNFYAVGVKVPLGPIEPGASAGIAIPIYAGPQDQDHLKALAPGLERVVDYGLLTVIADPLFWVLKLFHSWLVNWGLAIILLTVCIKLIFFPLSAASYRSMAKMKLVTPKLTKLREQYGDDKAKLNQAMMELYKTEKINPLGGCLPIVVQIPVFIHAPFYLWITDLSAPDPWYVLPTLMMASMIIQTKMNPTPPDPVQAKVMMIMPFAFGVMFFFFPSGLVLYWFVNNILSIAQQWQITRMMGGKKVAPKR
jgi:YidC/Oxa1 family membrane protein insertase